MKLTPVERAYIAGFLDGDGCVYFLDGRYKRPVITFTQKDPEVLEWIQWRTSYGRLHDTKRAGGRKYYMLSVKQLDEVEHLANALVPYSIVKRKELQRAVNNLRTRRRKPGWKPLYP